MTENPANLTPATPADLTLKALLERLAGVVDRLERVAGRTPADVPEVPENPDAEEIRRRIRTLAVQSNEGRVAGIMRRICPFCGRNLAHVGSLERHLKRKHQDKLRARFFFPKEQ